MPHGRRGQNLIGPEICGCYLAPRVRIIQSWEPSGAQIQAVEHLTEPTGFFSKASNLKVFQSGERLCFEIQERGEKWTVSLTLAEKETLISFLIAQNYEGGCGQ